MNIQSDSAASVCSHIHMTNIQCERKRGASRARSVCVCVCVCVENPDGNVVEIQNHTDTSAVWKMFGHSFSPFKVSTATFVCGLELCVLCLAFLTLAVAKSTVRRVISSEKEASHWFPSISNSYLAHLTTIK